MASKAMLLQIWIIFDRAFPKGRMVLGNQSAAALVAHEPLATMTILSPSGGSVAEDRVRTERTALAPKRSNGQWKRNST